MSLIFTSSMKPRSGETWYEWFRRQNFKHFTANEVNAYFQRTRNGVSNSAPPRKLWHRIVPTLRIVDDLRTHFGKPITITSSYRSPAYNRAVGSSNPADPTALAGSGSQHPRFAALDIQVSRTSPRAVYNKLLAWRRAGKFVGGLGLYSTFVHVDTRPYNATWGG
jgi:uncharacterized protein YcbK (DUF882 family)